MFLNTLFLNINNILQFFQNNDHYNNFDFKNDPKIKSCVTLYFLYEKIG